MKIGTRVEVTWTDACSASGWYDPDEIERIGALEVVSVGYFLRRNPNNITVAQSRASNGKWADVLVVPKTWVKKVRQLR